MGLHGMRFPGLREKAGGYVSKYASKGRRASAGRVAITGLVVLFLLSASSVFAASEDSLPSYLVEKWGSLTGTLSDALSLRDRQEKLPASAWFGADRTSNARKIDELLDRALEILVQGQAGDLRRQALELRTEIPKLRLEADGLRNRRISAPESSRLPWVRTRAKIDERLSELDGEIGRAHV